MRISLRGFEKGIELKRGFASVCEIESRPLFARVCRSFLSEEGEEAIEPYSLWSDLGGEIRPSSAFLLASDPLDLPWSDKCLAGRLYDQMDQFVMEDEDARSSIEMLDARMRSAISSVAFQIQGDYSFGIEWTLKRYLKAFSFSVELSPTASYLDSLILFIDFCADMQLDKPILFMNLKTFLGENELGLFYERIFFHELSILMLESTHDQTIFDRELKTYIDQHFIDY